MRYVDPAKKKIWNATYKAANKDRAREYSKKYYAMNKLKVRDGHLALFYGSSLLEFNSMLASQGGVCRTCGLLKKKMCLDHDHVTKEKRGILCSSCNVAIGMAQESPELLRKLAEYVEMYRRIK